MNRKSTKPKKSNPVYCFIVEGCTEENYLILLRKLYHRRAEIKNCKGGEAGGVLKEAERILKREGKNFSGYVIWFDSDRFKPETDSNMKNHLKAQKNVEVYMSKPCIERWLLAHFQSINSQTEEDCKFYEKQLKEQQHIPNYIKNQCYQLKGKIDQAKVEQAIKNYPELGEIPKKYFVLNSEDIK